MADFILEESIGFIINRTAAKLKNSLLSSFKELGYDVTTEQWAVLKCLTQKEALTQSEIADKLFKDKTNITRILDLLEKKELVVRKTDKNDRRCYRIYISPKGKETEKILSRSAKEVKDKAISDFSKSEIKQLISLLNKIDNNLG